MAACSRDGTARLWDCGEAKCLAVVFKSDCCVNTCALMKVPEMENGISSDIEHSKKLNHYLFTNLSQPQAFLPVSASLKFKTSIVVVRINPNVFYPPVKKVVDMLNMKTLYRKKFESPLVQMRKPLYLSKRYNRSVKKLVVERNSVSMPHVTMIDTK